MDLRRYLLAAGLGSLLVLSACNDDTEEPEVAAEDESTEEVTEEESTEEVTEEPTEEDTEEPTEEETEEPAEETDTPEVIADLQLTDVRNDNTGEWKKAVTQHDVNMPENAVAYYDMYMEPGDNHYIVSFATNTTINLNASGNSLYVTITEYQSGEEHDASELGSGMLYKDYTVDLSDGSIEEMDWD